MRSGRLSILAFLALTLLMGSYALSKEEKAAPQAPAAAAVPGFLAGAHDKEGIPCAGCHGQDINALDDGEQLVNANCLGCHATLAELGKKAAGHINPHATHLGEIGCTVCHHGHVASRPYCLNCHDFELTIQAAEGTATAHAAPVNAFERSVSAQCGSPGALHRRKPFRGHRHAPPGGRGGHPGHGAPRVRA